MWLARLTEWGMLRPCFVPPAPIRAAGLHPRPHRPGPNDPLLAAAGEAARRRADQAVQRGQQADHSVRAGHDHRDDRRERDPRVLRHAQTRMRAKHDALVEALAGMFHSHHGELAEMELDQIAFLNSGSQARGQHPRYPRRDPAAQGVNADDHRPDAGHGPTRRAARRPRCGDPRRQRAAGRAIIAETGLDMTRFLTAAHLVSWAGLCLVASQSGPRTRGGKKDTATPTCAAASARPPPGRPHRHLPRRAVRRSPAGEARPKPRSPSPGRSWSSSGTCSPTPPPATPTSARTRASRTDHKKIRNHVRGSAMGLEVTLTPAA